MNAHNGKIGRLPEEIRDQANHRLSDGEPAKTLLPWLNQLPEVRTVLTAQFAGRPISENNLSRWRVGGYQEWLQARERRAVIHEWSAGHPPAEAPVKAAVLTELFASVCLADFAVTCQDLRCRPLPTPAPAPKTQDSNHCFAVFYP